MQPTPFDHQTPLNFRGQLLPDQVFVDLSLLGLVVIQSVLAVGVALLVRHYGGRLTSVAPRIAGALILAVGVVVLAGNL